MPGMSPTNFKGPQSFRYTCLSRCTGATIRSFSWCDEVTRHNTCISVVVVKERARLQALQRRFRVYDLKYSSTTVERSQEHASLYKILYNILGRQATRALFSNLTAVTSTKIVGISHSKHTGMTSKGRLCHHPKPPRRNHPTETVAVSNSTHLSSLSDFFFFLR